MDIFGLFAFPGPPLLYVVKGYLRLFLKYLAFLPLVQQNEVINLQGLSAALVKK